MRYALGLAMMALVAACGGGAGVDGASNELATGGGGGATGRAPLVEIPPAPTSSSSTGSTSAGPSTGGDMGTTTGGSPGSSSTGGNLPCCHPTGGWGGGGTTTGGACTCDGACQDDCNTPLCLSFKEAPVRFVEAPGRFALADDTAGGTDWIGAETPWLALDRDGDGRIDDGRELFGSMTRLPDGRTAVNGFEALSALDTNHDGRITPADAWWSRLRLWSDVNQDRFSQHTELQRLSSRGIESLDLAFTSVPRCDERGNCEVERAAFWYRTHGQLRRGRIVDVHLAPHPSQPGLAVARPTPFNSFLLAPGAGR
jgi:hypothetical protein